MNVDYLRLSVTDRCNLNCIYCTPFSRGYFIPQNQIMEHEDISRLIGLFAKAGIKKLRITGGEPLIRKDIVSLVAMAKQIKGIEEISMTTNGIYLKDFAKELKRAGLSRINISLDTLNKNKFKSITGFDGFNDVWSGIMNSIEYDIAPVKLNAVIIKDINDDEIPDFVKLAVNYPVIVRFIEYFPVNSRTHDLPARTITSDFLKIIIENNFGKMISKPGIKGNGPAEYYEFKNAKGIIGFISGSSKNFCSRCNRIRVDCTGSVSPCLFSGYIYDLAPKLKNTVSDAEIIGYIKDIILMKSNYTKQNANLREIEMSCTGG